MKRGAVAAIAAAAAAVLIGGGGALWLTTRPPTAEQGAIRYLDALAAGDLATIVDMGGIAPDPDEQEVVARAFDSASEYASAPRIETISTVVDRPASVKASVVLDGKRRTLGFVMELSDGRWQLIGDYLATVRVTTNLGDSVWIGEALAPVGSDPVPLLPAVYTIEASPRGILTGQSTLALSNDAIADVDVNASLSPDATGIAQEQLDAYQDSCTQPAATVPRNCGLRVPWAADLVSLSSIAWRIDQRPALTLAPAGTTFAATGGIVVATATGVTPGGETASFTYRADDWALRGRVSFTADAMTLAVD